MQSAEIRRQERIRQSEQVIFHHSQSQCGHGNKSSSGGTPPGRTPDADASNSLTGLREDFERYKAERQKKTEPIEARVLSAILSSSATPYRQAPFIHPLSIAQTEHEQFTIELRRLLEAQSKQEQYLYLIYLNAHEGTSSLK